MGAIRMAALVTVVVAPDEAVAPGNVFEVATEEEALRLEEIGAATIVATDELPEEVAGDDEGSSDPDGDDDSRYGDAEMDAAGDDA